MQIKVIYHPYQLIVMCKVRTDVGDIKQLKQLYTTVVHLSYSRDNPRTKASGPPPSLHSYMKPEPKATSYTSEGALRAILVIHV